MLALSVHRLADMKPLLYEYVVSRVADFFSFFEIGRKKYCRDIFPREDISPIIISKAWPSSSIKTSLIYCKFLYRFVTLIQQLIHWITSIQIKYRFMAVKKRGYDTHLRSIVNLKLIQVFQNVSKSPKFLIREGNANAKISFRPALEKFARERGRGQFSARNDTSEGRGGRLSLMAGESLQRTSENQARVYQSRVPISTREAFFSYLPTFDIRGPPRAVAMLCRLSTF